MSFHLQLFYMMPVQVALHTVIEPEPRHNTQSSVSLPLIGISKRITAEFHWDRAISVHQISINVWDPSF